LSMIGSVSTASILWLGYFTDDSVTNLPVHLDVGQSFKGSLVFKASNIVSNGGSVRIGFFDYADGGTRVLNDGFGNGSSGNGINVRGYMVALNFGETFTGNPLTIYARNNLGSGDLMGTTGNYLNLGSGPADLEGQPAFQNDTNYTVDFTIQRLAVSSVRLTVNVSGGGTNWSHTVTDNTYAYPRFDSIGFRLANQASSASTFEFSRFLVQVAPGPIPLNIAKTGGNVSLSWANPAFILQAAPEVGGTYTNVPAAASPYVTAPTGDKKFFRLVLP
jgi:hypothetical protein